MKGNDQVAPHLFSNLLGTSLEQRAKISHLSPDVPKKSKLSKFASMYHGMKLSSLKVMLWEFLYHNNLTEL